MTVTTHERAHMRAARPSEPHGGSPTLADEHLLLLEQVSARAGEVLAAAGDGRWPSAELVSLAEYAGAEVRRQAFDEETLLFPAGPSAAAARLVRDHARLLAGAELLRRAAAGEQLLSAGQLAVAIRDFVDQLECHMSAEEKALSAARAPRTASAPASPARLVRLPGHPH